MDTFSQHLIILIIAYICVGVFAATALATVLDLFNLLKLARDIRKKLHRVLVVEIGVIGVPWFRGFLNPKPIIEQKARLESEVSNKESQVSNLEKAADFQQKQVNQFADKIRQLSKVIGSVPEQQYVDFTIVDQLGHEGGMEILRIFIDGAEQEQPL